MTDYIVTRGFSVGRDVFVVDQVVSGDFLADAIGGQGMVRNFLHTGRVRAVEPIQPPVGVGGAVPVDPSPAEREAGLELPASVLAAQAGPAGIGEIPVPVAPAPTVNDAKSKAAGK